MALGGYALLGAATLASSEPAMASPRVAVDSAVFVERIQRDETRSLEPARRLNSGDRLVYVVTWTKLEGEGSFVVTSPLPRHVAWQGSANSDEEVSVDGGRTWGRLDALRVGDRPATRYDVTHVRWRIAPAVASRGSGRIAYSAIVR